MKRGLVRQWLLVMFATVFFLNSASAQGFPERPITLVVPTPPGGVLDTSARKFGVKLTSLLGQPIVVDNRPGAGGTIAAEYVAKARPDGYTMFIGTHGTQAASVAVFKGLRYDPLKDFIPVHGLFEMPNILVAHPSKPYKTAAQFLAYAREQPGKVNVASTGTGSGSHIAAALFQVSAGIKLNHIPYKGSAPALTDLIGGTVDVMFDYPMTSIPQVRDGKLIPLAVTSSKRVPLLPEVPTVAELGFPDAKSTTWVGVFVPANTPDVVVKRISDAFAVIVGDAEMAKEFEQQGMNVLPGLSGARFSQFNQSEVSRMRELVNRAAISPE